MSLEGARSDRDDRRADDDVRGPSERLALVHAPQVLPSRSEGYAQRPTAWSNGAAFVLTVLLYLAGLTAWMVYRPPETVVAPPSKALVMTLLPVLSEKTRRAKEQVQPKDVPIRTIRQKPIRRPPTVQPNMLAEADPGIVPREPLLLLAPPPPSASSYEATPTVTSFLISTPHADEPERAKDTWESRVLARLGQYKHFPSAARARRDQGVATIRFRIDRQGRIMSSAIARSSGNALLDQEALATLARAEPLPPIPPDRPDEVELVVPIDFFLEGRH